MSVTITAEPVQVVVTPGVAQVKITPTVAQVKVTGSGARGPQGPPGEVTTDQMDEAIGTALQAHINDPLPHPAYDDIPSLTLIFENHLI